MEILASRGNQVKVSRARVWKWVESLYRSLLEANDLYRDTGGEYDAPASGILV